MTMLKRTFTKSKMKHTSCKITVIPNKTINKHNKITVIPNKTSTTTMETSLKMTQNSPMRTSTTSTKRGKKRGMKKMRPLLPKKKTITNQTNCKLIKLLHTLKMITTLKSARHQQTKNNLFSK